MIELRQEMQSLAFDEANPCRACSGRAISANTVIERAAHAAAREKTRLSLARDLT